MTIMADPGMARAGLSGRSRWSRRPARTAPGDGRCSSAIRSPNSPVVLLRLGDRVDPLQPGLDRRDLPAHRQVLDPGQDRVDVPGVRSPSPRGAHRLHRQLGEERPGPGRSARPRAAAPPIAGRGPPPPVPPQPAISSNTARCTGTVNAPAPSASNTGPHSAGRCTASFSASRSTCVTRIGGVVPGRRPAPGRAAGARPRRGRPGRGAAACAPRRRGRRPRRCTPTRLSTNSSSIMPSQRSRLTAYSWRSAAVLDPARRSARPRPARPAGPRRCPGRALDSALRMANSNSGTRCAMRSRTAPSPCFEPQVARVQAVRLHGHEGLRDEPLLHGERAQRGLLPGRVAVEGEDDLAARARRSSISSRRRILMCSSPNEVPQVATAVGTPARWQAITSV